MQQSRILDIIINLLSGIKSNNLIIESIDNDTQMKLKGNSYILNQALRQYVLPKNHYFVSEKAFELWTKISTDDIFNYEYQNKIVKNTDDFVTIDKYKGGEKNPRQKDVPLQKGQSFIYKDVFTDEHIVTVSNIIDELLKLPSYTYSSIASVLDKMYICKMLKNEDRSIKNRINRSTNYKEVILEDYLNAGIKIKDFDYHTELKNLIAITHAELDKLNGKEKSINSKMKLCPKCELNWIKETDKYCEVCSSNQSEPKKTTDPYRTTTSLPHVERTIKTGSVFDAKTHAELLNIVLGKNYKGYMQSSIKLPDGKLLWMIELGKFISSAGWINQLFSNNLIKETHVGTKFEFGHNTYKNAISTGKFFDDSDRVVFDVIKNGSNRKYIFRGVFRLNKIDSSTNENVWNLILDEYRI